MLLTYEEWCDRTAALLIGSDLPQTFVEDCLTNREAMHRLYEQGYAAAEVLLHLRKQYRLEEEVIVIQKEQEVQEALFRKREKIQQANEKQESQRNAKLASLWNRYGGSNIGLSMMAVFFVVLVVTLQLREQQLREQQAAAEKLGLPATITNSIGMKLVLIPAGEFQMGSPAAEEGRESNEQQHRVRITKPFHLGVHEVTQEQYERVMGVNPSYFKEPQHPVERVSWDKAVEFCDKLSALPAEQAAGRVYRLPTEAEWEYGCRAGTMTPFSYGWTLSSQTDGNFDGGYANKLNEKGPNRLSTSPVGTFRSNAWGLYNMHGNVWEWCEDWHDEGYYKSSPADDPKGPTTGSFRVNRGGSWGLPASYCRSAFRSRGRPDYRDRDLGFRVAAVPAGK